MAKKNKIQLMRGERGFHYTALVIMTLMMLFCIVPLVLMATVSLSSETSLVHGYRWMPIPSYGRREPRSSAPTD